MKKEEMLKEFARRYFENGKNGSKAYRDTYGRGKNLKDSTCSANASRLLKNAKVQEYLSELNKKAESPLILTKQQRMIWLSRVVNTPIGKVDEKSDLCQSHSVTESEFGTTVKITMPNKLSAIAELNKMDGAYEPEKIEVKSELSFSSLLKSLPSDPLVRGSEES